MGKLLNFTLGAVLAGAGVSNINCTSAFIPDEKAKSLERKVENSPYIACFEGMQPFSGYRIKELTEHLSSYLNIAGDATSGNHNAHFKYIEKAHENKQPIYLLGYSSGANDSLQLAIDCSARNIPIEILFHLDPTYLSRPFPRKVPKNVKKWMVYRSNDSDFVKGGVPTKENLEDPNRTILIIKDVREVGHMGLPPYATKMIGQDILEDLK